MSQHVSQPRSLALFCKVVDNYGDIGICWRFSRQLQKEHGINVTLWVDDLKSFQRICPEIATNSDEQFVDGIHIRHWRDQLGEFSSAEIADIVIEFFACDIPPGYIAAMATCTPQPVWLNLEGLSAEEWVEGCHTLPSPHPSMPLTKHFFFPGFTEKTGGLLFEAQLERERRQFQADPQTRADFLTQFGIEKNALNTFLVSLFCYPDAPVSALFDAWKNNASPVTCLIPEGVASEATQAFLGQAALAGNFATHGALTVRVFPFIPQSEYDKLLWSCDLNFVRGEDSFVRAQWAGKPFIWHIYPQEKNLHHIKLKAFLKRYSASTPGLINFSEHWNAAAGTNAAWTNLWSALLDDLPEIRTRTVDWQHQVMKNGDMTSNLLKFASRVRKCEHKIG